MVRPLSLGYIQKDKKPNLDRINSEGMI